MYYVELRFDIIACDRLTTVERMAPDRFGNELPARFKYAIRAIPVLIEWGRPATADAMLLTLEQSVGYITSKTFQERMQEIIAEVNQEGPMSDVEIDTLRAQCDPTWHAT